MGKHRVIGIFAGVAWLACGGVNPAFAQSKTAPPPPSPTPQSSQDVVDELSAEAIEVKGLVERASADAPPDKIAWVAVKKGDKLNGGTQIRTGLRSHLILRFGDASVVMIRRSTLASIDRFYRQRDTESIRLGLGYGAIRGGTTEGPVRSDFVVDSTVATLAKRGTEGWEMRVGPYTGIWRVSLAESGLVEALEKLSGQRRLVRPHEYANHANIAKMWVKQDIFNRAVRFTSTESVSATELEFDLRNRRGLGVTGPGLGSDIRGFAGQRARRSTLGALPSTRPPVDTLVLRPSVVARPEGDFGTGRTFDVLVPKRGRGWVGRGRHGGPIPARFGSRTRR